tara:strand:- start:133 stop:291 length:159 start_codon:yes stop_codon:yes gene_type:complete
MTWKEEIKKRGGYLGGMAMAAIEEGKIYKEKYLKCQEELKAVKKELAELKAR